MAAFVAFTPPVDPEGPPDLRSTSSFFNYPVASVRRQPRRLHVEGNDFARPGHARRSPVQVYFQPITVLGQIRSQLQ
jgi:hypothetical protein